LIAITGASGNSRKPAVETLLAKGEKVRVIGRDAKKLDALVQKGAKVFVENVDDAASLKKAFEGATAAYLVIPSMHGEGLRAFQEKVTDAYASAVADARVPYAITLSSLGAQHADKTGPIVGLHNMEQTLNRISGLNVLHLRPAQFMENLFRSMTPLRTMGILPGGSPTDAKQPWIATRDIGSYAAERLLARDFSGSSTQELLGPSDYNMKEVAAIIGKAIGKPSLGYMQVPFMMLEPALVQMGLPRSTAGLLIEMWKSMNDGLLAPQELRSAKNTTSTTLEAFASESFAPAYLGKAASA
jgi:uncharacterized protein YbjT (DUF2867 family)